MMLEHPVDVSEDAGLKGVSISRWPGVSGFFECGGNCVVDGGVVKPPATACCDGLLQPTLGNGGEEPLGDQAGCEDEAGRDAESLGADEPRWSEEDERGNKMGESRCEVHGDTAPERVADETEGGVPCPGERGGCEGEKGLGGVESGVVGEIADTVGEAAAEEVEEHHAAALLVYEGVGDLGECHGGGADAVDEEDFRPGLGPPFIHAGRAIL